MMSGQNKKRLWASEPTGVVHIETVQPGDLSFRLKIRGFASPLFSRFAFLQIQIYSIFSLYENSLLVNKQRKWVIHIKCESREKTPLPKKISFFSWLQTAY